uniref:Uncharacterized protein n=1 Tax=Aegilops tauschii subsp. strangulata TaxID=200361 RepID=A0A453DLV6_AEGTS
GRRPGSATTTATTRVRPVGVALLARPAATTRAAGRRGAQPAGRRPGGNPAARRRQTWPARPSSLCGGRRRSSTTRRGTGNTTRRMRRRGRGGSLGGHGPAAPCPSRPPASSSTTRAGASPPPPSASSPSSIDDANNRPLECIIRRVFSSTQDHECLLLCPVDMPVQVLKSTNFSGWIAVDDDQIKQIIPSVAYALARVHMHFVESGFCYTARGGFCFPEDAIQEFHDSSGGSGEAPFEGVEICNFNLDGAHYMIYTPVDPLLFVAVKDKDGVLRIAEDDLMDDPSIVSAIDEETEFTALVEEEEALLESILHGDDDVS